jgi:RNA polymerase sigma-70 factor (ECF subfamily)
MLLNLQRALASLPRRQQETVVMHYIVDLPVTEVARALGIAEGTVKTHLFRARETLREAMVEGGVAGGR